MGTQSPSPKRDGAPNFRPTSIVAKRLHGSRCHALGTAVGVGLRDIVLDGDPAPPNLKGHSHQFSAIVRCGQMAGWTKMPLGME